MPCPWVLIAEGKAKTLLDGAQKRFGMVPAIMQTMASSPAVLDAYLGFARALGSSSLAADLREQIALTVAEVNQCQYCLAAHSAIGKSLGLGDEAIADARRATAADGETAAVLQFVAKVVHARGWVTDADVERPGDALFALRGFAARLTPRQIEEVAELEGIRMHDADPAEHPRTEDAGCRRRGSRP